MLSAHYAVVVSEYYDGVGITMALSLVLTYHAMNGDGRHTLMAYALLSLPLMKIR